MELKNWKWLKPDNLSSRVMLFTQLQVSVSPSDEINDFPRREQEMNFHCLGLIRMGNHANPHCVLATNENYVLASMV